MLFQFSRRLPGRLADRARVCQLLLLLAVWLVPLYAHGQPDSAGCPPIGLQLVQAAEQYLGKPWVMEGRDGRRGCRKGRCSEGIDCLALLYFAFEKVTGTHWTKFPFRSNRGLVDSGKLGQPVPGLDGVARERVDASLLRPGDVLFFLLKNNELPGDRPLWTDSGLPYFPWHTGMFHSHGGGRNLVIHANPGRRVEISDLEQIEYDALFVTRLESAGSKSCQSKGRKK